MLDPDIFLRIGEATLLRRCIENGSLRKYLVGVGVVLVSPQNYVIPRAFSLTEPCSNNVAEYNALLIGMQIADEIGVKNLEAYSDSKLIINQIRGEYEVRHEDLVPYSMQLSLWPKSLETFTSTRYHASKCACRCTGISRCLFSPSSWGSRKKLIYSHDLYCPRVIFEDHQNLTGDCQTKEEALETSTGAEPRD